MQLINAVERMLLFAGSNVHAYSSTSKGLSSADNVHPDIIIFEASDSELSVTEVVTMLQSSPATQHIPLLIISDNETKKSFSGLVTHGIQEFIPKTSFDVMQLILLIESILLRAPASTEEKMFDFTESDKNVVVTKGAHTLKLLVIEDDPLLRNLLSLRLANSGIQYNFCHSGLDAVSMTLHERPTIILLDLMLPGKNGMEVLAEIRDLPEVAATPVIIFSNKDDDAERAKAVALGVTDFLVKATTDLSDLLELVISRGKAN